ncbi:glyoxylate/hydroxypyruvate reductase A [Clostridium oryzae]|uniref:Glyoxylate/hydroxypyruvate reductase A n=2 Tax=Clostridium oryzae TaxID=1450648 RepID=A0A1V4IKS9_9CLOT|nr:glyoxylate/hydroxypyruvate reductase A [Clostridium oryzae]
MHLIDAARNGKTLMNINRILVTGRLYKDIEGIIKERAESRNREFLFLPEDEVDEEKLKWADAYVGFKPVDNFSFYNMKWIHSLGAGVDSFILNRKWQDGILLTRTICSFGEKISEYCISYMLADAQKHHIFSCQQKEKLWQMHTPKGLFGQNVLILGTGQIAQEVAKRLSVFGCSVFGISASGKAKKYFNEVVTIDNMGALNIKIDWIISTLPHTKSTENMINGDFLNKFNDVGFINVGRGTTLDEEALLKAIGKRKIRIAVLDVFKEEPLSSASKLWGKREITITPHIAAITSPEEAVECFLSTLQQLEQDKIDLVNLVDIRRGY